MTPQIISLNEEYSKMFFDRITNKINQLISENKILLRQGKRFRCLLNCNQLHGIYIATDSLRIVQQRYYRFLKECSK